MSKKLFSVLAALLFAAGAAIPVQAALTDLGDSIAPHGYPAWYADANNLQLELCVPPPAGNATRPELCIFDPLEVDAEGDPVNPLVLTGESFYWMAMSSMDVPGGGAAAIEFAVEGTFGGDHSPVNGNQITFGRTRIRIDTPVAGNYTVTHPYGVENFNVAVPADGINVTVDIGSTNFLDPAQAFSGTLAAFGEGPVPFLTWPEYSTNEDLQVLELDPATGEPTGVILEQYIGDPNIASTVVGGPNDNIFRVQGPEGSGIDLQTDQFFVMGKQFDPNATLDPHVFPAPPEPNLFAMGPVNRAAPFNQSSTAEVTLQRYEDYAFGYPLWYQEDVPVVDETGAPVADPVTGGPQSSGLQLTLCPPTDVMCIADPLDFSNPDSIAFRTGGENFWFIAEAAMDIDEDHSALVTLAVEATFGGAHEIVDGNQVSFGRERIRIDTPVAGTYRVTHPYGVRIFENAPADDKGINFTSDIGIIDPADPDAAHEGTLYSDIGPTFLTWTTFDADPAATDPDLVKPNAADSTLSNYYIGDPAVASTVKGSPFIPEGETEPANYVRIERLVSGDIETGTWELVDETDQFFVAGKIYDPNTFEYGLDLAAPVTMADEAALDAVDGSVNIDVLANDTIGDILIPAITPAPNLTVAILPAGEIFGPTGGALAVNGDNTLTYTADAGFAGVDTFAYQVTDNSTGLTSMAGIVTVTVTPVETITIDRARFDTRKLRLTLRGTSNFEGSLLTIYAGDTDQGPVLGTAVVEAGDWNFRGTATANLTSVTVVSNSDAATTVTGPLQVR